MQAKNREKPKYFSLDYPLLVWYNDNGIFPDSAQKLSDATGGAGVLSDKKDYRTLPFARDTA